MKRHTRDEFVPGTREFRDRIRQELARGYSRQPDPPHCPGRSKLMAMRRCDEEAWECGRTALVGRMVEYEMRVGIVFDHTVVDLPRNS